MLQAFDTPAVRTQLGAPVGCRHNPTKSIHPYRTPERIDVRSTSLLRAALVACAATAAAHSPPLLAPKEVAALANELSGEIAKRNLEGLARFHRQRGSQGLHSAAELVAERARAYGLSEVQILQFPAKIGVVQ